MRLTVFIIFVAFVGCLSDMGTLPAPIPAPIDFGAWYVIVSDSNSPILTGDTLKVTVFYSGCNGNHSFMLRHRTVGTEVELWFVKETPDQPCRAAFQQELLVQLPSEIAAFEVLTLRGPEQATFTLRR